MFLKWNEKLEQEEENERKVSVNSVKFDFGPSKIFVGDGYNFNEQTKKELYFTSTSNHNIFYRIILNQ